MYYADTRMKPTKAQVKRFQALQEMGCIACKLDWVVDVPPDIHHLVEGYRLGHDYTIPLCPYHHRGVRDGSPCSVWGRPTLAGDKKAFVERYGTERELLG